MVNEEEELCKNKSMDKLEFESKLITEISKRPIILNINDKRNKIKIEQKKAWEEIQKTLNTSVYSCKSKWYNLRCTFKKYHSEALNRERISWIHYKTLKSMLFPQIVNLDNKTNKSIPLKQPISSNIDEKEIKDIYKKCGEIMISNRNKFQFSCSSCEENVDDIQDFIDHIFKNHSKFRKNSIELEFFDKTECKNDVNNYIQPSDKSVIQLSDNEIKMEIELSDSEIINERCNSSNADTNYDDLISKLENSTSNSSDSNENKKKEIVNEKLNLKNKTRKDDEISLENIIINKDNEDSETENESQKIDENFERTPKRNLISKKGVFPCDQCSRIFEYESKLRRHKRSHTEERPYICEICNQAFRHPRNLKDHISIRHSEERPYPCRHSGCEKKFKTIRIRNLHEILHTDNLPYQCQDCGKCFPKNSYLITHRNTWHIEKSQRRHKCDKCDKTFVSKQTLKFHNYTHTGEKPYGCPVCPTRFTKPWSVKEHMKIHSGERSYVCKVCGAGFNQIAGLIKHKKRHEQIVE